MADKKISALTAATTPLAGTEVLPIVQSSTTVKVPVSDLTAGRTVLGTIFSANISNPGSYAFNGSTNLVGGDTSGNATWTIVSSTTGLGYLSFADGTSGTARYAGRIDYNHSTNSMGFYTNGGVEAQVIDSSQNVKFSAGNLVQGTAAKGVNFTANTPAAGMTSQLLNWYEEGTWTPIYYGAAGSAGSLAYAEQTGKYTRIGRQVTVTGTIILSNKGSWTGRVQIGGFPFTPTADQYTGQVELRNVTFTGDYVIMEIGRASTSFARFVIVSGSGANTQVEDTNVANNSGFLFTLTYMV